MRTMCKLAQQPMLLQAVLKHDDHSDFRVSDQVKASVELQAAHLIIGVHCDNSVQGSPAVLVAVMLQPATRPSA